MIITLDFETTYTQEYSLRRMSVVDYVLHPMFDVIMCSIKVDNNTTVVHYGAASVKAALARIPWDQVALLSHNTQFDGAILAWRFGHVPRLYLDTLSMSRATLHAVTGSSSLASIAKYMDLPPKGDAVVNAMGKTYADFSPEQLAEYGAYCAHDTDLCRTIFDRLLPRFPRTELALIDLNLRLFIQPQAHLDPNKLSEALAQVRAEKAQALAQVAHIEKDVFSSNIKFAKLLEAYGVTVPRKISRATGQETYALARNDREFKELVEDEDQTPVVKALLAARMGVKSTIDETRAATMLNLSLREWGGGVTGLMPVPYRYYGAHTGRFSGDGGFNFANLRRTSPIRGAITAPNGYKIVHRDSSQIEARMVAWMAGCTQLLNAFAEGRDIYSEFASHVYGVPVTKENKLERFVGKTSILGLGYGMGWEKFRHTLFIGSGGVSVDVSDVFAADVVSHYRLIYYQLPRLWQNATIMLHQMIHDGSPYEPGTRSRFVGLVEPIPGITPGIEALWLPNGLCIAYPELREEVINAPTGRRAQLGYTGTRKQFVGLHGGKVTENCCQALARIVVTDISLRVKAQTGYHPIMMTYDSLDYCLPADQAEAMDALLAREFAVRPAWASTLPLASEGGWGVTLADAERGVNT